MIIDMIKHIGNNLKVVLLIPDPVEVTQWLRTDIANLKRETVNI